MNARATGAVDGAVHETVPDAAPAETVRSENVFIRNYDPYASYAVAVTVVDGSGETRFAESYTFRPGQIESVHGVLEPGLYDVTVELGSHRTKTRQVTVAPDPDHTIHVEVGNGVLSVTEGLYG